MEAGRRALYFSIRAVDAYRKTLLVDKVTSNDERSPPVYLLNEISDILSSCSLDLMQEIVEYAFRRLRHQNPQVKYKVLRFIKYTVNRSGSAAYRKELQSYSASIHELFNFQGQVDPFKGNSLNQAVRDAAHEAIKAIFSSDVGLPSSKGIQNRIEGFGNGNFSKSFVSSYRSAAIDETEGGILRHHDCTGYFDSMTCNRENESEWHENVNYKPNREIEKVSSPETELLDKVIASQGLRLQPTHECLMLFLSSARKLNAARIVLGLRAKLQDPSWQVRHKALCVLQALLHEKDATLLQAIEADVADFCDCVQECLLSAQTTLRKKAKEVFDSLQALKAAKNCEGSPNVIIDNASVIESCDKAFVTSMPIQSDDGDASFQSPSQATTSTTHQVVDLLSFDNDDFAPFRTVESSPNSVMDDPFDGMCIHGSNGSAAVHVEDFLSGGWTDSNAHHVELSFGSVKNEQNLMVLQTASQSNTLGPNQYKTPALGDTLIPDIPAMHSTTTAKGPLSSLDSQTLIAGSKGIVPDLQNHNASYMFPMGIVESSHNFAALQQCPGGTQGFEFGMHTATPSVKGHTASVWHGHGDIYFKEFGLSN